MSRLDNEIKYLKGVGPRRAEILNRLGLYTVRDLLTFFPRDWIDRRKILRISELRNDEYATISGKIKLFDIIRLHPRLSVFKAAITDSTGVIYAVQYKKPNYRYDVFKGLSDTFKPGQEILVYGKVSTESGNRQITLDDYAACGSERRSEFARITPVYQLTEGLNMRMIRGLVKQALSCCLESYPDVLTVQDRKKYSLMTAPEAVRKLHFPESYEEIEAARERFAFDEFLFLELAMSIARKQVSKREKKHNYEIKKHLLSPFKENLGFEFTNAQKKAINEIFADLNSKYPMNRLLIGDVGSGKTVVALSAVLLALENNYQVVFMVPTEILAEQHYFTILNFFKNLRVRVELLTGSTTGKKKKEICDGIKAGAVNIVVGTHSLLEENVVFRNLVLAVIDEQHKFGVLQRQKLQSKAFAGEQASLADILIMTATPIPRTLALTLYNDLDISVIDELPPGRTPVATYYSDEKNSYEFLRKEVKCGRQAYIVFPLVNESDKVELRSVIKEGKRIASDVFPEFRVGLLHGQMPGREKQKVMVAFREGKYDIIVTTTVIEVGIDVPNATVMVIHHADRFGLATLHQLRGRIGRSSYLSTCFILGEAKTEDARKRFEVFCSTCDGFKVAEVDLQIRGPGDFFGTAQHGVFGLKVGNIFTDSKLVRLAREHAGEITGKDEKLVLPQNRLLRDEIARVYGGRLIMPEIL